MRQVNYLQTHEVMFIPGVGQLESTIPCKSKTLRTENMHSTPEGVALTVNGVEGLIPWANIKYVRYAPKESL